MGKDQLARRLQEEGSRKAAEPKARADHQTLRSQGSAEREVHRSENGTSVRKQEETSLLRTGSARSV